MEKVWVNPPADTSCATDSSTLHPDAGGADTRQRQSRFMGITWVGGGWGGWVDAGKLHQGTGGAAKQEKAGFAAAAGACAVCADTHLLWLENPKQPCGWASGEKRER